MKKNVYIRKQNTGVQEVKAISQSALRKCAMRDRSCNGSMVSEG